MKNTWIELDLNVLSANIRSLRAALSPSSRILFVVKSNAYGHGMMVVAQRAWEEGVKWFVVARLDEALSLRQTLPEAEILVVGVTDPADAAAAVEHRIITVLASREHALALASNIKKGFLRCHVKLDTGMGRIGFPWQTAHEDLAVLADRPELKIEGVVSHFAKSDDEDRRFSDEQFSRFKAVLDRCQKEGRVFSFRHISNSGGILRDSAWDMDGVRSGILLYGYGAPARGIRTRPCLQWKTRVVQVKKVPAGFPVSYGGTHKTKDETCVATLDAGYADGFIRRLSNQGFVLIGGRRCPIAGRVTMNLTMADLGAVTDVKVGDEVVLIGKQGEASLWADEMAGWCDTIPYEVLTSIRTDDRRLCGS